VESRSATTYKLSTKSATSESNVTTHSLNNDDDDDDDDVASGDENAGHTASLLRWDSLRSTQPVSDVRAKHATSSIPTTPSAQHWTPKQRGRVKNIYDKLDGEPSAGSAVADRRSDHRDGGDFQFARMVHTPHDHRATAGGEDPMMPVQGGHHYDQKVELDMQSSSSSVRRPYSEGDSRRKGEEFLERDQGQSNGRGVGYGGCNKQQYCRLLSSLCIVWCIFLFNKLTAVARWHLFILFIVNGIL